MNASDLSQTNLRRGWLKNGNPPGDPSKAARCGARTRKGSGYAKWKMSDARRHFNWSEDARGNRAMPTCKLEARRVLGERSRTATNVSQFLSRAARRSESDQTRHSLTPKSGTTALHGVLSPFVGCTPLCHCLELPLVRSAVRSAVRGRVRFSSRFPNHGCDGPSSRAQRCSWWGSGLLCQPHVV